MHSASSFATWDLACGYFEPQRSQNDLMLFAVYLDGSGKLQDPHSAHVTLVGLVLRHDRVQAFNDVWAECFKTHAYKAKRRIPEYLHTAAEALRCKGEFEGWLPSQVNDLLMDLARLMREYSYRLIAAPANKARFIGFQINSVANWEPLANFHSRFA